MRRAVALYERRGMEFNTILVCLVFLVCAWLFFRISDAFDALQRNRVELTKEGCKQRNADRLVIRQGLVNELRTIRKLPDSAFVQFKITRSEAIRQKQVQIATEHPIDCRKLTERVRDTNASAAELAASQPARTGGGTRGRQARRTSPARRQPQRSHRSARAQPPATTPQQRQPTAPSGGGGPAQPAPGGGGQSGGGGGGGGGGSVTTPRRPSVQVPPVQVSPNVPPVVVPPVCTPVVNVNCR